MSMHELVIDQPMLESHCERWRAGRFLAFDTEFIRDDTYEARLCLVQAVGGEAGEEPVLIDPTAGLDLAPFWALVTDPNVVTVVHAGKEDFEVCLRASGKPPRSVFDIQIGAGFVGYGYPLSLSRLVELVCKKRLAKGQTLTDWALRPLTEEQLHYAVEDVIHLPSIYQKLNRELDRMGRTGWARDEFTRFESPEHYVPPVLDRVAKLKGSKNLDGLGMLLLERLIRWRDAWAQEKNRPVRALVRDDVLVEIARRRPRQERELAVLRGFPQSKNARVVKQVMDLIEECRATPKDKLPRPAEIREESPMMKATVDLLSAAARAVCFEDGVSYDLVGGATRLRELVDFDRAGGGDGEPPTLLRGWRREFIGNRLIDLLHGRRELRFSGWPKEPRLDVVENSIAPESTAADADRAGDAASPQPKRVAASRSRSRRAGA